MCQHHSMYSYSLRVLVNNKYNLMNLIFMINTTCESNTQACLILILHLSSNSNLISFHNGSAGYSAIDILVFLHKLCSCHHAFSLLSFGMWIGLIPCRLHPNCTLPWPLNPHHTFYSSLFRGEVLDPTSNRILALQSICISTGLRRGTLGNSSALSSFLA